MTLALYGKSRARQQILLFAGFMAVLFGALLGVSIWQSEQAGAATFVDDAGANDEPGQKDLTQLSIDDTSPPTLGITWNWDEVGVSGQGQSLDACSLFDTDSDGFANFSICANATGNPANAVTTFLYVCEADSKVDRCGGPAPDLTFTSSCSIAVTNDDPFATGDEFPNDLKATCSIQLGDISPQPANATLLNVCSYPSGEPNSDPSDCVFTSPPVTTRGLRVQKVTTTAAHPGGTFSGTITPGGADAANDAWSQTLAANAANSAPGENNTVSVDAQTVAETSLPANWTNVGFYVAVDSGQACPTSPTAYSAGPASVPANTNDYLVCVLNTFTAPAVPTLTVTKSNDTTGAVPPGTTVHYTITLTITNGPLTSVTVNDVLPTGIGAATNISDGGTYNAGTNTVTWVLANAANGETLTYDAVVSAGATAGTKTNTATATHPACSNQGSDCTGTSDVTVFIPGQPSITKTLAGGGTSPVTVTDPAAVAWVVTVTNPASLPGTNRTVVIRDSGVVVTSGPTFTNGADCTPNNATAAFQAALTSAGGVSCTMPGSTTVQSTITFTVAPASTPARTCRDQDFNNTASFQIGTEPPVTANGPTITLSAQADASCITVHKTFDNVEGGQALWEIRFVNSGPEANIEFSDTYQPNTSGTTLDGDGGLTCDVENTTQLLGCAMSIPTGTTNVTIYSTVPRSCQEQTVSNSVVAFFGTTQLQTTQGQSLTASHTFPSTPELCTRDIRVVKVSGGTHPGGTFSGTISPGGSTADSDAWSQTLGANGTASAGETNTVTFDEQTIAETSLAAGWVQAGYYVALDDEQSCPTDLGEYNDPPTVPQGDDDYLVCVRNAYVTVAKVSANVNGSSEPYAPGEQFHWDITVTIAGGRPASPLQIVDTWDDSVVNLWSLEPPVSNSFDCEESTPGTVTCTVLAGTNPGTYTMAVHMEVRPTAGCGTTTNNIVLMQGQTELDSDSDDVPLDCRRTIQLCKAWRLDAQGELPDAAAANFSFNVDDAEEAPPGELVSIGGVEEDGDIECILMDVRFGTVTIDELASAGFVLDGWNFQPGNAPDGTFPADFATDPAAFLLSPLGCSPALSGQSDALLIGVLGLVADIQALVMPATGQPLCTITFVNHDLQDRLPTGDLRIEKYLDINGDGDADDAALGEGLTPWDVTIVGPDPAVDGDHSLVGGTITFSGLTTGHVYTVTEDLPAGFVVTNATVDGVSGGATITRSATIPNGGTTVIRFYNQPLDDIHVHKNAETVHNNGSPVAAPNDDDGWTITVDSAACNVHRVGQTDANGNVSFTGLPVCTDYVVAEVGPNAASPGFVQVAPAGPFTNQRPDGQTLTFLNRRSTFDPPCQDCRQPTITPSPTSTPTATPTTPTATPTNTAVPNTPTNTPVTNIAGERTPGQTPIAPSAGNAAGSLGAGMNVLLLLAGLVALSGGFAVLALRRR